MSINIACISGNITREPEIRLTANGTAILGFSVAVNERRKSTQTGEWEDYANFIDVKVFGKRAESLSDLLSKGMKVSVAGSLRQSRWEKDGQNRSKIEIIASEIELPPKSAKSQGNLMDVSSDIYDDEVPF